MSRIMPCIWVASQAREAAALYTSIFPQSRIDHVHLLTDTPGGETEVVDLHLCGMPFQVMHSGAGFPVNPSISFVVTFATPEAVDAAAARLLEGGQALMPVDTYPFNRRFGWVADRWGVTWQIMVGSAETGTVGTIAPFLLFTGAEGKAEEAVTFYTDLLPDSSVIDVEYFSEGDAPNTPGAVKRVDFVLDRQSFSAMDGGMMHNFTFNEAISLCLYCDSQQEIDQYWAALSADPAAEQCGWLKDRWGVSWQIVPRRMDSMLREGTPEQVARVVAAFMPMKKLDIAALETAYAGDVVQQ